MIYRNETDYWPDNKAVHFSLASWGLALGVALLPVYTFSSGGVQPAHIILIVFALATMMNNGVPNKIWVWCLAGICIFSLFVESFYVITGTKVEALMNGIFLLYNFLVVTAVYSHCRRLGLSALTPGVLLACAIAIFTISVSNASPQETGESRVTGTFNNPNQLGYFSVCILSLTYLLYRHDHIKYLTALVLFMVAIFFSIASLSKAAMIANFLVAFLALKPVSKSTFTNGKTRNMKGALFWLMLVLAGVVTIMFFLMRGSFDEFMFMQRLQGITQEDDSSLVSRGYLAFLEGNTLQLFLGLGSIGVTRIAGHEVHSTLASIFNNYGVVGFVLFALALSIWAWKLWRAYGFVGVCCLTGPAMLYGITHNGTRFTVFWVLFGASMAMASCIIERQDAEEDEPFRKKR